MASATNRSRQIGAAQWQAVLDSARDAIVSIDADGIVFRSNHASNYLSLAGDLQKDKQRLLQTIDDVLDDPDSRHIRPEHLRRL